MSSRYMSSSDGCVTEKFLSSIFGLGADHAIVKGLKDQDREQLEGNPARYAIVPRLGDALPQLAAVEAVGTPCGNLSQGARHVRAGPGGAGAWHAAKGVVPAFERRRFSHVGVAARRRGPAPGRERSYRKTVLE